MATVSHSAKPVKGTCRWLVRIGDGDDKSGLLLINGQRYAVLVLPGGYRLIKPDGTAYDLEPAGESFRCDCPDAVYRERECKHAKALCAALAVLSK